MPVLTPAVDRARLALVAAGVVVVAIVVAVRPVTATYLLHLPSPLSATCALAGLLGAWAVTRTWSRRGLVRAVVVLLTAGTVVANVVVLHHWVGGADLVLHAEMVMGDPDVDLTDLSERMEQDETAVDRAVVLATRTWAVSSLVVLSILWTSSYRRLGAHRAVRPV